MHFLIVGQMQMDIPALCQSKDHRRQRRKLRNPTKVDTYWHVQKKRTLRQLPNKSWDQILCSPPFGRIHPPCEDLRKLPVGWDVPRQKTHDVQSHVVDGSKLMQQLMQLALLNRNYLTCFWKCWMMIWLRAGHVPFWPCEINSTPKPGGFSPCYRCKFTWFLQTAVLQDVACRQVFVLFVDRDVVNLNLHMHVPQVRPIPYNKWITNQILFTQTNVEKCRTMWSMQPIAARVWKRGQFDGAATGGWPHGGEVGAGRSQRPRPIPTLVGPDPSATWRPRGAVQMQCGWWSWEWCLQDWYEW